MYFTQRRGNNHMSRVPRLGGGDLLPEVERSTAYRDQGSSSRDLPRGWDPELADQAVAAFLR